MRCYFLDDRIDFFGVLNAKLGEAFSLIPVGAAALDNEEQLADCNVLIVGLPLCGSKAYEERLGLLQKAVLNPARIPVVAFLRSSERQAMRDSISAGAYDSFVETGSMEELAIVLRRAAQLHELSQEIDRLKSNLLETTDFEFLVGTDPKMVALFSLGRRIASTDATVLISGETGTGKELLARGIHQASTRARDPFVAVACSSLPEGLIEAELFGHEKGAFTGAVGMRRGRFEAAQGGTLFLDEIGELSPALQVKLLRVLQERTFERLGSNEPRRMEARVICATNRDLKMMAHQETFRPDLYYRLNTIELHMPPLRERRDDIVLLAHHFLQKCLAQQQRTNCRLSPVALVALKRYSWPGNVRELQHVIERAVVICDGPGIRLEHLPTEVVSGIDDFSVHSSSFEFEVQTFKRHLIQKRLRESGNNKVQAARLLKISRSSLHRLIDVLGVQQSANKVS